MEAHFGPGLLRRASVGLPAGLGEIRQPAAARVAVLARIGSAAAVDARLATRAVDKKVVEVQAPGGRLPLQAQCGSVLDAIVVDAPGLGEGGRAHV